MKIYFCKVLFSAFLLVIWAAAEAFAAGPSPNALKPKQEAEARGYTFIANHDEIVAMAKREGKLHAIVSMDPSNVRANTAAFKKKYPFIDISIQEIRGRDATQRLLLDIKSGGAKEWDIINPALGVYLEYPPYLRKVDVLGMASHGVLQIPVPMIDPKYRNVIAIENNLQVPAYNTELVPANMVPKTWEDFLRPEFKGRKLAVDVQPSEVAALVPAWGLEKTLDFARKIAAQQPVWVRGGARTMPYIASGEIPIFLGPNFGSVTKYMTNDPTGRLQYAVVEPVPVRFSNFQSILATSQHPHAALLWLEWMAGPEAQKITDETEPNASSIYTTDGVVERKVRGKKLSVVGWEEQHNLDTWEGEIVKAYGFPKAR
jgi:ABC-type Fe3+ transport system substrate-binding protein